MYSLKVTYKFKSKDKRDGFYEAVCDDRISEITLKEEGCERYEYVLPDSDTELLLFEQWESKAHQQIHLEQGAVFMVKGFKMRFGADTVLEVLEEDSAAEKEKCPYSDYLGIEILSCDENGAKGRLAVADELLDNLGHMTGGAYAALADAVGGAAARANGDMYVTQNCSLQFYQSTEPDNGELLAAAEIRHRGSRTCIAAVELSHVDGTVVADGQFSYSKI